jgi:hypothetical protein
MLEWPLRQFGEIRICSNPEKTAGQPSWYRQSLCDHLGFELAPRLDPMNLLD